MKSPPEGVDYDVNPQIQLFEEVVTRDSCGYKDLSEKFRHTKRDFARQYCHVYSKRLQQMKGILIKRAHQKWGDEVRIVKLAELSEDTGAKCVIIGTLFKDQELRPSILKELSDELEIIPQKKMVRFVSENDKMILEDEEQRIMLIGNINVDLLVTGICTNTTVTTPEKVFISVPRKPEIRKKWLILMRRNPRDLVPSSCRFICEDHFNECAVLGSEDHSGKFEVEDVCFSGPQAPSPCLELPRTSNRSALFLSGLDLATHPSSLPNLQLLVHWLSGWLGSHQQNISFVLIAGGLIRSTSEEKDGRVIDTNVEGSSDVVSAVELADEILAELSETMNVELMPGQHDPTNYLFPQQPMHLRMFPKAMPNKTFNSGPNPHQFQVDNILIVGSSGEAVKDIGRYSQLTDPLEALENSFNWGHLAPTSPDSLGSYPYFESDPFILENQPDIFFSSNHDVFQTKLVDFDHGEGYGKQSSRLICIPSFSKTNSGVLVNLDDLEARPISVDISS